MISLAQREDVQKTESLRFYLVLAFAFFLPFDRFYSTLIIFVLLLTTLIDYKSINFRRIPKVFWIFQVPIFLSIIGYFYSNYKAGSSSIIERQMVFVILPILLPLSLSYINKDRINSIFRALKNGSLIAVVYLFLVHILEVIDGTEQFDLLNSSFYNHLFSAPLEIHATYLSIYIIASIVFLSTQFFKKPVLKTSYLIIISELFVLLAGLFFLASRNSIITFLFLFLFIFPFFFIKKKVLYLALFILISGILAFTLSKNDYLYSRFGNELVTDIASVDDSSAVGLLTSNEPRVKKWELAIPVILNSPVYGHGTGDEAPLMKPLYYENGFIISYVNNYNIHNQYISVLIRNGFLGLILFMFYIFYNFRLAIRNKSFLYVSVLIIMTFGFLTENILDSNKGIFFFAFFNTILGYYCINNKKREVHSVESNELN